MTQSPVRAVIIGAGNIGRRHILAAQRAGNLAVVGICDTWPQKAQELGAEFGIPTFPSLKTALKRTGAHVVNICTPPVSHGQLALESIALGRHVIVEKPFDTDKQMIERVARAATDAGVLAGAIAQHRFSTGVQRLHRHIASGGLGTIQSAAIRVSRYRQDSYFDPEQHAWRSNSAEAGGGVLSTIGFHYLDLLCLFVDSEPRVCNARRMHVRNGVELGFEGTFRLGPTTCKIRAAWGNVETQPDRLTLTGTSGQAVLLGDCFGEVEPGETLPDKVELHSRQLADFASAVANGTRPRVNALDVAPAMNVIFQLYAKASNVCQPEPTYD